MDDFEKRLAELQAKYREAVFKESAIREAAFLPVTLDIGGIAVKQFTPYMYILLDFVQSPFISGDRRPDGCHVAEFLWVVSTEFKENDEVGKKAFIENKCADLEYFKTVEEIETYLMEAFIDIPPTTREDGSQKPKNNRTVPFYSWVCSYIDALASEYGWTDDKVIHMPFARILQYSKCIEARKWMAAGKEPQLFNNLSDKAINNIRRLYKEQEKAGTVKA